MDPIEFLNQNTGVLSLLFSFVVAGATVFYARLTKQLVSETKKMREAQTEPMVSVRIEPSSAWINLIVLVVENVGLGPAYNIRFQLTPDFEWERNRYLSELGLIKRGLRYLAPKQNLRTFLTNMIDEIHKTETGWKEDEEFSVTVTYENAAGREIIQKYPIYFAEFEGLTSIGTPPLETIAKTLGNLQKDLSRFVSGSARPRVISYSPEDVKQERDEFMREREGRLASGSPRLASEAVSTREDAMLSKRASSPIE